MNLVLIEPEELAAGAGASAETSPRESGADASAETSLRGAGAGVSAETSPRESGAGASAETSPRESGADASAETSSAPASPLVDGVVLELRDRRAAHLLEVVRVAPGSRIRVGVVDGGLGHAEVLAVAPGRCTVRITIDRPRPAQLPVHLILAIPRPKVLLRTIAIAASFGVERIDLTNSWRVDKSYLGSPALLPAALARAARDGAEQGATSRLPTLTVHRRLMSLLDEYPGPGAAPGPAPIAGAAPGTGAAPGAEATPGVEADRAPSRLYLLAHPGVSRGLEAVVTPGEQRPLTLAVGPEGGWIERELSTFEERGFAAVSLGASILRVEAAIASLLGQVQLLRRLPPSGDGPRP